MPLVLVAAISAFDWQAALWAPALLASSLIEVHAHAWDQAARPAAALDFFGPFPTLGALLAATPGVLRADELQRRAVVPVCYGGTFAAVWISLSA